MRFDAVLFDCDGVLVDSERMTNGVLRHMLQEQGWPLRWPWECPPTGVAAGATVFAYVPYTTFADMEDLPSLQASNLPQLTFT